MLEHKYFRLVCLLAPLVSNSAIAQIEQSECPANLFTTLGQALKIHKLQGEDRADQSIVARTCKLWPYDERYLLTAFAYDEGVEYEKTYLVAIIDAKSLTPLASYKSVIYEDAVTEATEGSLSLDTAKYQLSPKVRAFGVRFSSGARGASCGDGRNWDELTLFMRQQDKLVPVFKENMQSQESFSGCLGSSAWEYTKKTIAIANTTTNGLADLQMTRTAVNEGDEAAMPKNTNGKPRVERYLVKFNGKSYAP